MKLVLGSCGNNGRGEPTAISPVRGQFATAGASGSALVEGEFSSRRRDCGRLGFEGAVARDRSRLMIWETVSVTPGLPVQVLPRTVAACGSAADKAGELRDGIESSTAISSSRRGFNILQNCVGYGRAFNASRTTVTTKACAVGAW